MLLEHLKSIQYDNTDEFFSIEFAAHLDISINDLAGIAETDTYAEQESDLGIFWRTTLKYDSTNF